MHEKFGFKTKRLTVLKAYEEDTTAMIKVYRAQQQVPKDIDESILKKCMRATEEDFYQDLTFLVRDKSNKVIGIVGTKSDDKVNVEIEVWIPNQAKRTTYLVELIDSMIEWCKDYEKYQAISGIQLIDRIGPFGATFSELKGKINLKSAL